MEINDIEYQYLLDIKGRYDWLLDTALQYSSLSDSLPNELYIRGTGLRDELKRYRSHDYKKRVHELLAEKQNNIYRRQ